MEQRYKNRESREEDVFQINNLNRVIQDREQCIEKLNVSMQFYILY